MELSLARGDLLPLHQLEGIPDGMGRRVDRTSDRRRPLPIRRGGFAPPEVRVVAHFSRVLSAAAGAYVAAAIAARQESADTTAFER